MHNQHEQRNNYNRRTDKTEFFADNRKDKIGMIFGYINNAVGVTLTCNPAGADGNQRVCQLERLQV